MVLNIVKKKAYAVEICEKAFGSEELQLLQDSTDSGLIVADLQNGLFGSKNFNPVSTLRNLCKHDNASISHQILT